MNDQPMLPAPDVVIEWQFCDGCGSRWPDSDDGLRVRGWWVFDGKSETGQPLRVRRCQNCQSVSARPKAGALPQDPLF